MAQHDDHHDPARRDLLRLGVASACLGSLPDFALSAPLLSTRPIPTSGEALPVIGLGTSRVFDIDLAVDTAGLDACRQVLAALLDAGATLVDSSPMYGQAEAVSGELASSLDATDTVFWATKVWANGRDRGIEQMEASMRLFHTDQIDLMQVHNLRDWREHMPVLRDWKSEGRIRYIGITHSRSSAFGDVEKVITASEPDFVQLNYSMVEREAEARLLPLCADKGIATLINRPFARGALFEKAKNSPLPEWATDFGAASWGQFFLKFVLAHPAVTCVIPATSKARHMVDNVAAGFGPVPDADQRQAMIAHFAAL